MKRKGSSPGGPTNFFFIVFSNFIEVSTSRLYLGFGKGLEITDRQFPIQADGSTGPQGCYCSEL